MTATSSSFDRQTTKRSYKKHRTKEEIVANILRAAQNSATKTRIMRRSYMNYNLLQKYLYYAASSGLLVYDHRSNEYLITSKGIQYLDHFEQYVETKDHLMHKKRVISSMLENDIEPTMLTFNPEQMLF
ncbi:MAG: winged helix-turn-helix domain-containing protein [Thermoproteota archaeon]|nr:winged helix-turn-helix domain-containing protein [Thermoproteota archaeon]